MPMTWFPQGIGELDTPQVRALSDRYGAEGLGVYIAAKTELYRAVSNGCELDAESLSKAVSRTCGISRKRARNVLDFAEISGVFREKNDKKVEPLTYDVRGEVQKYDTISKQRKRAAGARWWHEEA